MPDKNLFNFPYDGKFFRLIREPNKYIIECKDVHKGLGNAYTGTAHITLLRYILPIIDNQVKGDYPQTSTLNTRVLLE